MTAPKRVRRAGSRWRVLVHEADREDTSIEADGRVYHQRHVEYPGTEFDELVVGRWIHIEQMDIGYWWMNIGGVTVHVRADRDGRPKHVMVHGPNDYAGAVEGCEYEVVWSGRERAS